MSAKSHYFVQRYEDDEGNKICPICGEKFKSNYSSKKFCSRECYLKNAQVLKARWFQQNKERTYEQRRERNKNRPPPKSQVFKRHKTLFTRLKYKKCVIIKKRLMEMELASTQLCSKITMNKNIKKNKIERYRHGLDGERILFIKERLHQLGLPFGEVKNIDKELEEVPKYDIKPLGEMKVKYTILPPELQPDPS